jgi:hypothetical protein
MYMYVLRIISTVDGKWTSWGSYGSCTVTCGGGTQRRSRTCSNPAPKYLGKDCPGSTVSSRSCSTHHCPSEYSVFLELTLALQQDSWLIDCLRFYVPLKNFLLIWRRYHYRWRAAKFRSKLDAQGLWAGRDFYRATLAVTRGLGFSGLFRRITPFSRLLRLCMSIKSLHTSNRLHFLFNAIAVTISNVFNTLLYLVMDEN